MEYLAKIIQEKKSGNGSFWEYTFVNLETGQENYFLNNFQINYLPSLGGKLKILGSVNQQPKIFQSFEQDIDNTAEGFNHLETLIRLERDWTKSIRKVDNYSTKKEKIKLTPQKIFELRKKGLSWKEIRDFCGVSEWTIRRWKKEKLDRIKQKGGRKKKITGIILAFLHSYITKKNTSTQEDMIDYLFQQTGLKVNQSTISRTLKRENITYKTATARYSEQKSRMEEIREFMNFFTPPLLSHHNTLALDECSFHLNEAPRHAYSRKGLRAFTWKPGNKGDNYTLILCIKNIEERGMVHYQIIKGGAKAENFHNFLTDVKLSIEKEHYLMLDNARIHHATWACRKVGLSTIKELLIQKNIKPIYLPPYTPELNLTELCFGFIRKYVEKYQPRKFEELEKSVSEAINILNQKNSSEYFRHCLNFKFC